MADDNLLSGAGATGGEGAEGTTEVNTESQEAEQPGGQEQPGEHGSENPGEDNTHGTEDKTEEGKTEDPEDNGDFDLDNFLEENGIPQAQGDEVRKAIEAGVTPEAIQYHIDTMKNQITLEREKISPELKTQLQDIGAWVNAEENEGRKDLYNLIATRADGLELLNELRTKSLGATGAAPNKMVTTAGGMNIDTFIGEYNKAQSTGDKAKLESLKSYAKGASDPVYREFMLID